VQLHISAPLADIVFEEPAGGIERVAHRDMGVFMRMMSCRVAPDHDLAAGDGQVDTDMKQIALLMARILEFDSNAAGYDAVEDTIELLGPLADTRRKRL
jgi:hypothetical protein